MEDDGWRPRFPGVPERYTPRTAILLALVAIPMTVLVLALWAIIHVPSSAPEFMIVFAAGFAASWYLVRWLDRRRRAGQAWPIIGCGVLLFLLYVPVGGFLIVLSIEAYGWGILVGLGVPLVLGVLGVLLQKKVSSQATD